MVCPVSASDDRLREVNAAQLVNLGSNGPITQGTTKSFGLTRQGGRNG